MTKRCCDNRGTSLYSAPVGLQIRRNRRPLMFSLLLTVILVVCTGWPHALAAEQLVEIDVPLFLGGEGRDFYEQAARDYEKVRPNVRVNLYADPRITDRVRIRILEG